MSTSITFPTSIDGASFDSIVFDVNKGDRVSFEADITDNPIERSSAAADHVRARPVTVSIDALITDYPISTSARGALQQVSAIASNPQAALGLSNRTQPGRSVEILETLRSIQSDGRECLIDLGDRAFSNMAIKSITVPRDRPLSGAFRVQISFQQIRTVRSQTVEVAPPTQTLREQPARKAGKQATTVAAPSQARKSWAASGFDGISDGFKKLIAR